MQQFELGPLARLASGQLPGGYKQRLAMAAALLHEPEILFLDEPTSGADPLARREFWRRITALAEQGVTVIVTTHFMEEAEYCDRVAILDAGRVLAQGTPGRNPRPRPRRSRPRADHGGRLHRHRAGGATRASRSERAGVSWHDRLPARSDRQRKLRRIWALVRKESLADPARSEQHRHRHRDAGDADLAVRLWPVA